MTSDEESWESWELPDPDPEPARAPVLARGTPTDQMIGRVLGGRYRIESLLGKGAMGAVYKARHVKVGRVFAIKVLHSRLLLDPKTQKRFEREANLAGTLHHPNVVGVIDVGETDNIHFMVMEFAEGKTLGSMIVGPMEPKRVLSIAQQLCDGLQHAHEHGLIHRDFKPENVIVEIDKLGVERPRIVDFGIAILREDAADPAKDDRLTTAGLVLGTPHYMAPEHAMGGSVDHRIDLFALGVILYEMLTGTMPFEGDGVDVARANLSSATPAMGVRVPGLVADPMLEAFTRLLMQKKPSDRPDSAKAARHLLELIETDPVMAARILGVTPPATPAAPGSARRLPHASLPLEELSAPHVAPIPERPAPQVASIPSGSSRRLHHASLPLAELSGPHAVPAVEQAPITAPQEPPLTPPAMHPYISSEPPPLRLGTVPRGSEQLSSIPLRPTPMVVGAVAAVLGVIAAVVLATRSTPPSAAPAAPPAPKTAPVAMAVTTPRAEPPGTLPGTPPVTPHAATQPPAGNAVAPVAAQATKPAKVLPPRSATIAKPGKPATTTRPAITTTTTAIAKPAMTTPGGVTSSDVGAVAALYAAVGRELKDLDRAKGTDAISPLWMRYRIIRIQDALTTQDKRVAAMKTLSQLRREAAAAR